MQNILVVTTSPNCSTGIAYFSHTLFSDDSIYEIAYTESKDYTDVLSDAKTLVGRLFEFDIVLVVLGNSIHNLFPMLFLQMLKKFKGSKVKVFLEIHDPVLNDIVNESENIVANNNFSPHEIYYENLSKEPSKYKEIYENKNELWRLFVDHGIMGSRYLAENFPIHGFIFHSEYALNSYHSKLKSNNITIPWLVSLFHPCFDNYANTKDESKIFDAGIFGVMDNGGKMTNVSMEVIHNLRSSLPNSKFILAGYNAEEWVESNRSDFDFSRVSVVNNPSRDELFELMAKTKVALQPRAQSSGESSGIIPMLISAGTYSLVSKVGAFTEYNTPCVIPLENKDFAKNALQITTELISSENPFCRTEAQKYITTHSQASFCGNLNSIFDKSRSEKHIRISKSLIAIGTSYPQDMLRSSRVVKF